LKQGLLHGGGRSCCEWCSSTSQIIETLRLDEIGDEPVSERTEPPADVYDIEYALRQLRATFQLVWETYELRHEDVYTKYGAVEIGRDNRFPVVRTLELGSLHVLLRIPAAIVGAPFAALVELLSSVLDLDVKIRNHPLRREKERLQLEVDILELQQRYDALIATTVDRSLPRGKMQAIETEIIDLPTEEG
jgi:hypothetical protein